MTREPSLAACRRVAMEWPECCGSFSSMQASVLTIYTSQERASVSLRIPALRFLPSSNTEPHSPTEMITSLKSWGRISAAPTTSSAVSGEVSETTIIGTPALRPSAGLPPVLRRRNGWGCGAAQFTQELSLRQARDLRCLSQLLTFQDQCKQRETNRRHRCAARGRLSGVGNFRLPIGNQNLVTQAAGEKKLPSNPQSLRALASRRLGVGFPVGGKIEPRDHVTMRTSDRSSSTRALASSA